MTSQHEITRLLADWSNGDRQALEKLTPLVYDELRRLAGRYLRQERVGHTLQSTALVHEAYMKLVGQNNVRWQNRAHFFGIAAQMIRRILVDYARARRAGQARLRARRSSRSTKRSRSPAAPDLDLVALDDALEGPRQDRRAAEPAGRAALLRRADPRGDRRSAADVDRDCQARLGLRESVAFARDSQAVRPMHPDRWRRIKEILDVGLRLDARRARRLSRRAPAKATPSCAKKCSP